MTNQLGVNLYDHGFSIFSKTGIEIVYLYFQIPLMILVIAPAIDGLRREWSEASSNLGASSWQFWRHVGMPILTPSILGAFVLLFGNSFAAYATAYGLTGGSVGLVPIRSASTCTRQRPRRPASRPGARVRHVRRARADDALLHPAPAPRVEVVAVTPRKRIAPDAVLWLLLGAVYFLIPLIATLIFSLRRRPDRQVLHARRTTA